MTDTVAPPEDTPAQEAGFDIANHSEIPRNTRDVTDGLSREAQGRWTNGGRCRLGETQWPSLGESGDFSASLRSTASLISSVSARLVAAQASAAAGSSQLAEAFEGTSDAAAEAAVGGFAEAVLRVDEAMALLAKGSEELSAYMADVLGPGRAGDAGGFGSGESAARRPARLNPSTPLTHPAERATALRLADDPAFDGRVFNAPPPPDPGHDWVDDLGRTYDAMGDGTKAKHLRLSAFTRSIDHHLKKGERLHRHRSHRLLPGTSHRDQRLRERIAAGEEGDHRESGVLMLSIRFGEDREWWTSSGNFERLLSSAIQIGHVAPEHGELRDVAAANGGLDLLDDVDAGSGDRLVSGLRAAARHDLEALTDAASGSIDDSYRASLAKFLEAVG